MSSGGFPSRALCGILFFVNDANFIVAAHRFLGNPLAIRVVLGIVVIVRIAVSIAAFVLLL
jgi:hypothetical protein